MKSIVRWLVPIVVTTLVALVALGWPGPAGAAGPDGNAGTASETGCGASSMAPDGTHGYDTAGFNGMVEARFEEVGEADRAQGGFDLGGGTEVGVPAAPADLQMVPSDGANDPVFEPPVLAFLLFTAGVGIAGAVYAMRPLFQRER